MAEYIEKEALLKIYNEIRPTLATRVCEFTDILENFPSIDINPVTDVELQPVYRKPVIIFEDEFWVQGYLVREKYYCCPNCEKILGNLRVHNVYELINEYKFCNECGQGLDWNEIKEVIAEC